MLTDRQITLRTWEKDWIRVTDENRGQIFAYSFVSGRSPDISAQPDKDTG
jgi:hypothetical protein